jgi:hypothetical protein
MISNQRRKEMHVTDVNQNSGWLRQHAGQALFNILATAQALVT